MIVIFSFFLFNKSAYTQQLPVRPHSSPTRRSSDLPEAVRGDCARAIARHGRFAPLVALYANDVPAVSAIMLREVRLAEADWLALLPATSAMARSVLAGRSDLPQSIGRALEIGRASGRERVCQSVLIPVVAGKLKKKKNIS